MVGFLELIPGAWSLEICRGSIFLDRENYKNYELCNSVGLTSFVFDSQMRQEKRAIWEVVSLWVLTLSLEYDSGEVEGSDFLPWCLCFHCIALQWIPDLPVEVKCILFQKLLFSQVTHISFKRMLSVFPCLLAASAQNKARGSRVGTWVW